MVNLTSSFPRYARSLCLSDVISGRYRCVLEISRHCVYSFVIISIISFQNYELHHVDLLHFCMIDSLFFTTDVLRLDKFEFCFVCRWY